MHRVGFLGVAALCLLTTACRFEIQMPEAGGAVVSERFRCDAGETCVVEIEDATFDETFTVETAQGYEFAGWLKAAGHYCGDSLADCPISSTALVGELASFVDADITLFLVPQFICAPDNSGQRPEVCDGEVTKTISGQVTDAPVPNADVTVSVGAGTFETRADELGFYSLDVSTSDLDALVRVSATGTSQAGQPLEFIALADSFDSLEENAEQDVTNVTTAGYLLAVDANGGQEPATLGELQAAETAVDGDELLELAAVIKLVVDDPDYSLPEGFDNLLDFAGDEEAVDQFVADVGAGTDADAVDDAEDEIINDDTLVEGFVASRLPARYFEVPSANPGYLARSGSILEFDIGSNTGRLLSYDSNSGTPQNLEYTWNIAGGKLVLEYTQPLETTSFVFPDESIATAEQLEALSGAGVVQVTELSAVARTVYTLLTDGALVDLVQIEEERLIRYEPQPAGDEVIQLASRLETSTSTSGLRAEDAIEAVPFVDACGGNNGAICVPGTWGASIRYSPGRSFFGDYPVADWGDVVSFDSNGLALGAISNVSAEWRVEDGKLLIDYSDGWTQTVTIVDQLGVEYGVFKEFSNGSDRFADYSIYVKADTPLIFSDEYLQNPADRFWNGEINTWIPEALDSSGELNPDFIFGWSFNAEGDSNAGFNERAVETPGGLSLSQSPVQWNVDGNVLNIERGFGTLRSWYPLTATTVQGDRQIYVIEVQVSGSNVEIPARLNIERERLRRTDYINDPIGL